MYLTDEEKRMLDGEYGYGAQTGMKILVALGKVFDAEKLIPVRSAHVAGTGFKTFGKPGVAWLEDLVEKGAKVRDPYDPQRDRRRPGDGPGLPQRSGGMADADRQCL